MTDRIAMIAVDWGTSNRRAWALDSDGRVLAEMGDGEGLLKVDAGGFARSFADFAAPWLTDDRVVPVLMCGMVGSKMGWAEVPYIAAPADLASLSRNLYAIAFDGPARIAIVPGVSCIHDGVPDVMRGEECQVLAVLTQRQMRDACLLLPGTHSKWVQVKDGRLDSFRTYMTGELYNALTSGGTLAQLMEKGEADPEAFRRGLARAREPGSGALPHLLFGVRTLGLFNALPRAGLSSYLSGLLIGTEMRDALAWSTARAVIAVGSPRLLENYRIAAGEFGLAFEAHDNSALLPPALHMIARDAGL
ncbi:2-dehydro-3-deoxygalactonokinase [Nordella sp. HKS 07]|uniref:2-dehydro-3-deoxygalactonokinase n=1 Tax=Nordella sp. HKS 07 TaxID=2712222 RepID=UPI0013E1B3C3|nr:2-dehydro-3-deoxygalactonokinase [Nordella sp. HKS 07]QIG48570.1 2-dehydro-3-deoxygalactonokinase [Nordella sp. HKS 07]